MLIAGLLVLAAVLAGALLRSEYEKRHFVTDHYTVVSDKLGEKEQNFVFLSDLHNNEFGPGNSRLVEAIARTCPDGVLIGGDMMVSHGDADLHTVKELVEQLAARWPVYYANGNHEERIKRERCVYGGRYEEFLEMLEKAGVTYLSDRSVDFGPDIRITGCNMEERYYRHHFTVPRLPEGELRGHVGRADDRRFQILLLHSPLFFESCRKWGADLTLSGHFHGGTIRLPFLGGLMTPQYQFFLPWCAGRFDEGAQTMIVSRGLGTHSINIRFNDRPQLVWITLKGKP